MEERNLRKVMIGTVTSDKMDKTVVVSVETSVSHSIYSKTMKTEWTYEKRMENKVLAYCRKTAMFATGDKVVLGVSGGADSICLLFALLDFRWSVVVRIENTEQLHIHSIK